jgi:hypothetical protein
VFGAEGRGERGKGEDAGEQLMEMSNWNVKFCMDVEHDFTKRISSAN